MGVGVNIELLGARELSARLHALPLALQKRAVRSAIRKGGKILLEASRTAARAQTNPANASDHMIQIAEGLKLRSITRKRGFLGVKVQTGTKSEHGIPEASKWFYPAHIEFGSSRAPARPYLRPPLDEKRDEVFGVLATEIEAGILREGGR